MERIDFFGKFNVFEAEDTIIATKYKSNANFVYKGHSRKKIDFAFPCFYIC